MAAFRLQPLIQFAEERREAAAQELQRLRIECVQAEEKLQQLEAYLADYRARLAGGTAQGMTIHMMMDFQRFIAKLDIAIRAQTGEVELCHQRWKAAQHLWQEREREVKAYHALRERHEREELRKENKRDQRVQDEFAQISHRRLSEDPSRK